MFTWRDAISEEARRRECQVAAEKYRLIQTAKGHSGKRSGSLNRFLAALGSLLVSSGRSLQSLDPAPSNRPLEDAKA